MRSLIPALALLLADPAHAQWRLASTEHFRLYGELPEDKLRERAALLEDYRDILAKYTGSKADDDLARLIHRTGFIGVANVA